MSDEILFSVINQIGIIQINRPRARNALNWSAQEQFSAAVEGVSTNKDIRVLIIAGSGNRAFASGGDLKELAGQEGKDTGLKLTKIMGDALKLLPELTIPVIGAVNGDAIGGGCEILTACDLRIAAPHARFRFAQVQVALSTGWGGTARLIRLVGLSRASELILSGRSFNAGEALDIGFIHRIISQDGSVLDGAREWALEFIKLPAEALASTKQLLWRSAEMSLADSYQLERSLFIDLWPTPDHIEAMAAFAEKRHPNFKGDRR